MRRVLGTVGCLALAALLAVLLTEKTGQGQFAGYIELQTITQSFSITVGAGTSTFPLNNQGQIAHSIQYQWSSVTGCVFTLDGSTDGSHWSTLAAGQSTLAASNQFTYANGFFSQLRIKATNCATTTLAGVYTGYQVPLPINPPVTNFTPAAVASPVQVFVANNTPYLTTGLQCNNPNAAAAFLQLFDSANGSTPTLGTAFFYQVGIPAGALFNFPSTALLGTKNLWMGAATAAGGNTAVGTGLNCSVQVNLAGPFYPLVPNSP